MHTIYIRIRVFSETSPKASEAFIFYFRFRTFNLEVKAKNRTYPLKCFGDEVNIGLFFFFSCVGGFLQLASGTEPQYSPGDNQICGSNERYAPPVVFFADDGLATLLFQ
jgi:hypothetical protein